jgi:hypothetical protein
VRRCLQEQGYVLQDQSTDEWNALYDRGHFLLRERYRDHTDRILDEFKFLGDQFDQDPQNKAFAVAIQKLFRDLGTGQNGKVTFKPHLVKDLTNVIIPGAFERTRYVPIPRIEVSDPMVDAVVENLVIESDNLFPNIVEFGSDNYFRLGRRQVSNKSEHKVMIAASGIQMDLRDVAYYVKKKQGFPSLTDKGVMDVFLGGEGFSFKLAARTAQSKDRTHFVSVDNVTVNVKHLNIKIKQSNHKLLFNIAKPLLLRVMKPVITKVIEKQIRENFEKLDAFMYDIYQDVQKASKQAQNDPENADSIFQQYLQAYRRKIIAQKDKAQEKVSKTTSMPALFLFSRYPLTNFQLTWQLPNMTRSSRTSRSQVASRPKPRNSRSLPPREINGNRQSSALGAPKSRLTFRNCLPSPESRIELQQASSVVAITRL